METNACGNPTEVFQQLLRKYEKLGFEKEQLSSLDTVKQLRSPRKPWLLLVTSVLVVIVAVFLGVYKYEWPITNERLLTIYFKYYGSEPREENCLIGAREIVMDFFRPAVECDFCVNFTGVKTEYNLSQEDFETKYAYSGVPVLIADGMKNWTASQKFSFKFFKNVYAEDSPVYSDSNDCQFFPYKTEFESLKEVFNMSDERANLKDGSKPWYIGWSNCDSSAANILRKYYGRPYFLPSVSESSKTDWIFMGSPGYGAPLHIDHVEKTSWQAQVIGDKTWTLQPPNECYYKCPMNEAKVTVHPGQIIVIDTNRWFHATNVVSKGISITIGSEYD